MRRTLLTFCCVSLLTASAAAAPGTAAPRPATESEIAAIRAGLQGRLKDADSAKFKDLRVSGTFACGQLNAKNSFGAYEGFVPFLVMVVHKKDGSVGSVPLQLDPELAASSCAQRGM